jgi:tyrosyl-tRNA synthetase
MYLISELASYRKLLLSGGLYVNGAKVLENKKLSSIKLIDEQMLILRTGKSNCRIVHFYSGNR